MSERQPLSKRLRFEILKRDGFRCRYCGANSSQVLMHVDHVVPVADGGGDDPANLVTACADCNLGKSDVPLDQSRLNPASPTQSMIDHAEQIRAYMDAVAEVEQLRVDMTVEIDQKWDRLLGAPMAGPMFKELPYWIGAIGYERVLEAVTIVAGRGLRGERCNRYFFAILRNMRDGTIRPERSGG
jgi:hypothetical protein